VSPNKNVPPNKTCSSKRMVSKIFPVLLAGSMTAWAPQAQAQDLFEWLFQPQPQAPAGQPPKPNDRRARPVQQPVQQQAQQPAQQNALRTTDAYSDPAVRNSLYGIDRNGRHDASPSADGGLYNRGASGQGAADPVLRGGGGVKYAALPPDADPNYSTPVDLDSAVNYKQATQKIVPDPTGEPSGTLTINTGKRKLYYSLGDGQAVEYGIAVGKAGFSWKGQASIGRKAYWPGWTPPPEMIERRPELPDHMDGSMSNPLGARALYLFQGNKDTLFRIHGTNEPSSIGRAASSGCIRMHNADVIDLYGRVSKGAHVVVM
jgi:lipoprotein-anchoring transpeptidase ErfK/SrfK